MKVRKTHKVVLAIGVEPITSSLPWNYSTIGAMQANKRQMKAKRTKKVKREKNIETIKSPNKIDIASFNSSSKFKEKEK